MMSRPAMWSPIMAALLLAAPVLAAKRNDSKLGQKPQMGWNSWNTFKLNVSAELVESTTDALVAKGLAKLGYEYVIIDDGWQHNQRDANGRLAPNQTRFPDGISKLSKYVHDRGIKIGLYSDAGIYTCGFHPGSHGYEELDAYTFAEWEVDYLKYDNCGGFQSNVQSPQERFLRMAHALRATGHDIFYSLCEWGWQFPWFWADQFVESYRISGDIHKSFATDGSGMCTTAYCLNTGYAGVSVLTMIRKMREVSPFQTPGSWADMDMLELGTWSMTALEEQTHFTFWAALKSPLIIGADLNNISDSSLAILKNEEIIELNQDDNGTAAHYLPGLSREGRYQVWAGPLSSGHRRYVMLVLNEGPEDVDLDIPVASVPGLQDHTKGVVLRIRDVWEKESLGRLGNIIALKGIKPTQTKVLVFSE